MNRIAIAMLMAAGALQVASPLPTGRLTFGAFTATFSADRPSTPLRAGAFTLEGDGWPTFKGTWKIEGSEIELIVPGMRDGCEGAGRYRFTADDRHVTFDLVADGCVPRRMILDRSSWRPAGEAKAIPVRRIERTAGDRTPLQPRTADAGSWPSFRGPLASGISEKQALPDTWNVKTGEHVLWKTPIPGLAHSSPIVWGDRVFVTSAISSQPNATFRPGLYGDGDASDDRTVQRWVVYAIDKRTGKMLWERVAREGEPRNKRHIKSTYASATPVTDGKLVVAWFGSEGVYAYDVDGRLKWKVDLGRVDMGAYDIPTYEWGPASSPMIWNGLVILQCDTQADSFLLALNADTGETVWRTSRDELPSCGSPTVALTSPGPQIVTRAPNYIRGYAASTGRELWRLGGSSKITAP